MSSGNITLEFILLCGIQIFTMGFSAFTFIRGFKQYRHIDRSEIFLRKSVKYFIFIFITILIAGFFTLLSNFYFLITDDGFIAGYIYGAVTTSILLNVFCAWQFLTYLIHPNRRSTKYIIGIYCIIGIILIWIFAPTVTSVLQTPNLKNNFLYIYLWAVFAFVWSIFAYDFLALSRRATKKKDKYRFLYLGLCGVCTLLMFPLGMITTLLSWIIILTAISFLYLGRRTTTSVL